MSGNLVSKILIAYGSLSSATYKKEKIWSLCLLFYCFYTGTRFSNVQRGCAVSVECVREKGFTFSYSITSESSRKNLWVSHIHVEFHLLNYYDYCVRSVVLCAIP